MPRRLICSLLLFAYAAQLAAVAHAHSHGGRESADEMDRPHIHLSLFGHRHHDLCIEYTPIAPAQPQVVDAAGCDDHDCDTVYLPAQIDAFSLLNKRVASTDSPQAIALAAMLPAAQLIAAPRLAAMAILSENSPSDCPLYLMLRTLRL